MEQDDEMKYRQAMLQAMRDRTPRFILMSIALSCLGWLLAYLAHSLAGGVFVQIIAIAIPLERHVSMRRYAKHLKRMGGDKCKV
jgi:Flp pilus assembly protein TadB